jgi:signal transduction histidine kinase/DNA-binding response OmpR family regulator
MPDRDVPRVLVIDDDARVRHFLTTALGAAGFAVTATGTGEEGLRLAASRPELVVLDVELPDLSGREVCRRLKAAEDTAAIPVLMLSGVFTAAVDRSEALEDGSDAYLTKPVTSRELVAMARALLRTARAERRSHEHQRAAEELRRRVAQSKAMVDVARSITASLDLQGVLDRIVDEACLLLGARRVAIAVLEAGAEPMPIIRFRAARGLSPAFAQRLRPLSWRDGTTPIAIRERRPVWTADILTDRALELTPPTRAIIEAEGYRAVLSVPLLAGERVLGAIVVYRDLVGPFSEDDIDITQVFAAQAAVALENADLYRRASERAEKLTTLSALTRLITGAASSHEVFGAVAQAAVRLLAARASQVWVDDPANAMLRIEGTVSVDPTLAEGLGKFRIMPHGDGLTGAVFATRTPIFVRDLRLEPRFRAQALVEEGVVRAYAGIPLVAAEGVVVGVLSLLFGERGDFTDEEKDLVRLLADQAAIAIVQAQLYGEAEGRRRRAEATADNLERSQGQLVKTERLRALGEMAAGVAHDFNNLLSVILGRAELMLRRVREPSMIRDLEAVRRAAQDGADTVRRIQEFTRTRRTRSFERVDLADVAREVIELTRPRWEVEAQSRGVRYEFTVEGLAPPVAGRPEELREVLTNLITNAVDAMPDGGRCTVRLDARPDWAAISVKDTGVGMPEEMRRRVFEPFFTSKGPRGTGLGLAVSWGIVTRHGGTIEVDSAPGEGSTFVVRLPIPVSLPDSVTGMTVAPPSRTARVLIIEDEPEVQAVLADMLREAGYVVVVAKDGPNGLERCELEPMDIVLSDISMPGLSGWDVATRLRTRFPEIPIGFVTGWGDQLDPERLTRTGVSFVIAKPFQTLDVLRHVAQALNAPRPAS